MHHLNTVESAKLADDVGEAPAVDQAHDVVRDVPLVAHGVHRDDVLVVEAGGRLHLDLESPLPAGVEGGCGREDLHRDPAPAQRELAGLVDDPHAAAADLPDELEVAEHVRLMAVRRGDRPRPEHRRSRVRDHRGHELHRRQQPPQAGGPPGMVPGQLVEVNVLACLNSVGDRGDPFDHLGVLARAVGELSPRRFAGDHHGVEPSSSNFRIRSMARKWRTLAAFSVIWRAAATSAKGRSSR